VDAVGEDAEAEQIPTIFEPFRRVSNGPEGLGLGLYIVKEIVRAHGGTIEVRSSADEGTTFACLWRRKAAAIRSQLGALISSA
jgi:signal transduction histidine kinase